MLDLIGAEGDLGTLGNALLDLSDVLIGGTIDAGEVSYLRQRWSRETQEGRLGSDNDIVVGEVEVFKKSLEILSHLGKHGRTWLTKYPVRDHVFYGANNVFKINFSIGPDEKPQMGISTTDREITARFNQLKGEV